MKVCEYSLYQFDRPLNKIYYAIKREDIISDHPDILKLRGWYLKFEGYVSMQKGTYLRKGNKYLFN